MTATRTTLLLAALFCVCTPAFAHAADKCGKLATIERWQGNFTLTANADVKYEPAGAGGGGLFHKYHWQAGGAIDLLPHYEDSERSEATWHGEEQNFTASMNDVDGQLGGDISVTLEASKLDENDNSAHLSLNCDRGEYRLNIHTGRFLIKRRVKMPAGMEALCAAGASNDEAALPAAMLCALMKEQQEKFEKEKLTFSVSVSTDDLDGKDPVFDAKKMTLTGTRRVKTNETMLNGKELEADLTWSLSPGKPLPYEAVIVTNETFRKWIPEANKKTPTVAGSAVAVEVKLRRKDKPNEPAGEKGRFEFELLDVSHAPGWCTNFPREGDTEADLRIEAAMNTGMNVPEPYRAETKEDVAGATLWLSSFDMGAHARLRVRVKMASGARLEAYLDGKPGVTELRVPLDDDNNQVADEWQKENKVAQGRSVTWDEDRPLQKRLGDGYTLYEEYRGFMTKAGYVRTSPDEKDLFVYDVDGLVATYYEDTNPASLVLRYIDPTMMEFSESGSRPDDRWVNFNSRQEDWYARQYAMAVRIGSRPGDSIGCARLIGADCSWSETLSRQALKNTWSVEIDTSKAAVATASLPEPLRTNVIQAQLEVAVMHEMMHALEVYHHTDIKGDENDVGRASGMPACIMRYYTDAEYDLTKPMTVQNMLCRKGQTWQRPVDLRAPDGRQIHTTLTTPAHDCWSLVDLKTDPE